MGQSALSLTRPTFIKNVHGDDWHMTFNHKVSVFPYQTEYNIQFKGYLDEWGSMLLGDQIDDYTVQFEPDVSDAYWWKIVTQPMFITALESKWKYPIAGKVPYDRGWD